MDLLKAGFWPLVVLIFVLLCFACFARPLMRLLEDQRHSIELDHKERQLALQESEQQLEEARQELARQERLKPEQDKLDATKLRHEAAENEAATEVIEATRQDRIDAEKAIIAASIQTRIALNNEALLSGKATANSLDAETLKILADAHADWCRSRSSSMPFGDWLGDFAHIINQQ